MTAQHDLDQQLNAFLREGPDELPYQSFDAVRDRTEQTRQRVIFGPRRLPEMNKLVTVGLGAVAVVAVLLVGAQIFRFPSGNIGADPTANPEATATPAPSAAQTGVADFPGYPGAPRPVDPGIYHLPPGWLDPLNHVPVSISFVVPPGWLSCTNNAGLLCSADGVGGVNIWVVTNVAADPCDERTLRDPAVGPTVDDLVIAISSLPWSAVTPTTEVTVDGFRGKEFEVTAPAASPCVGTDGFATWATTLSDWAMDVSPNERNRLRILEVQDTRVLIAGYYGPETSLQDLAEINAIIDSVHIEPQGG